MKSVICLVVIFICAVLFSCKKYEIEEDGIPQFVETDFTDIDQVQRISKFRSGSGHDYSDKFESCRSMKHYYSMDTTWVPTMNFSCKVYAPVDGKIVEKRKEKNDDGYQIWIKSEEYPAFYFIIFHINNAENVKLGDKVNAGNELGITYGPEIAVRVRTSEGFRLISYFDVISDEVFKKYQDLGISSREVLIISKEERDANPIECNGDELFPGQYESRFDDWVFLSH